MPNVHLLVKPYLYRLCLSYLLVFVPFATQVRAIQDNFEDPTYHSNQLPQFPDQTADQRAIPQANTSSTTITTHPLVFFLEQETVSRYPDYQNRLVQAVADANQRFIAAGIYRRYSIQSMDALYDKNSSTNCKATNPNGKNLPALFCNHPRNYILVAVDETSGSNYSHSSGSVEWHGYNGLFGNQGLSVLSHELAHQLGAPDLYHLSIVAANNRVNQEAYAPFQGTIMHNLTPGVFDQWTVEIINRENTQLPARQSTWVQYQPQNTTVKLVNTQGKPVSGVHMTIFSSDPSTAVGGYIDDIPEYAGSSNQNGELSLGANVLGQDRWKAIKALLIRLESNGKKEHHWFNMTHINQLYWQGQTNEAVLPLTTSIAEPPPNCPGVEITSIAGVCSGNGYQASVNWNAVAGATEYYIVHDDDTQFWSDNPEIGEPVLGANTTQTTRNIAFTSDKTRYFRVRITKSSVCTPQNWLYGSIKTITAPVCKQEDINKDGVVNLADYQAIVANFTSYSISLFNRIVSILAK